jgi:CubicO group peptidase (beta-lactamase class C family)
MRIDCKRNCLILLLTFVLTVSLLGQGVEAQDSDLISTGIEDEIERLVADGDIPTLHACVVSGTEIDWVKGFGDQTDLDTTFLIGSVQKVFVAISILQLYEDGLISLDDDVNDYLPFDIRHPDYPDTPITIQMLLSHRSGLQPTFSSEFCYDWEGGYTPEYRSYIRAYYSSVVGISLGEYLSMVIPSTGSLYSQYDWIFEPDSQFGYSNTGYKILMYLLELVSNQTISMYMHENIFGPLRMNNTGFNATEFIEHHAIPHTRTHGNNTNMELPVWNGQYMLRSSARDMGHLLIALMNEGQFDGHQLLQQDTLSMMLENTDPGNPLNNLRREIRWQGYGFGIEVRTHGSFGHGGSTVGFTAECYFNPASRLGYIKLSNVNAILDSTSTQWQDINSVTSEIRTLVLTHLGMIPAFDPLLIIMGGISCFSIGIMLFSLWRKRRRSV